MHVVRRTFELARLKNENQELRMRGTTESSLIGASSAISQVRQTI